MEPLRTYGSPPFHVAVVHGGPGAPGQMAPVARALAARRGVLEPLQSAGTLDDQVQELREVLGRHADGPVTLLGSSWGAMLSYLLAARHPSTVRKLILVGSAVFQEPDQNHILESRLQRLLPEERAELLRIREILRDPHQCRPSLVRRMDELLVRADHYAPVTYDTELLAYQPEINRRVWSDAVRLRGSGQLLALGRKIRCPVLAIHGDHDPHLAEHVREPLSQVIADFRFVVLARCGHLPWIEREARADFFRLLEDQLPVAPSAR